MRNLLLILFLPFFSCENPPAAIPESRADKLAKALCNCTEQLFALNSAAESTQDSLSFQKISAEATNSVNCAKKLGIKPEDRASLEAALSKHCPTLAAQKELFVELMGE